jgi:hypothetical protein
MEYADSEDLASLLRRIAALPKDKAPGSCPRFPPAATARETPAGYAAVWADEASFARKKAMQPGTCSTLNPCSRSGPLNSYFRNRLMYRS